MKIKFLSAAFFLSLAICQAQAYDFYTGGIAYDVLSNTSTRKTVAVTYITNSPDASGFVSTYSGDVIVPDEVNWNGQMFKVTQIGDRAMFNNQSLYTLKLPEGISSIGNQAFSHCYSMYSVNVPATVSRIADYAFEYCEDLQAIILPASLIDMGDGVFQQCYGLQYIEVAEGNPLLKSDEGVLYKNIESDTAMTLLVYPGARNRSEYSVLEGTAIIDSYALSANSSLKEITLPRSLKRIDLFAFSECLMLEAINVVEGNVMYTSDNGVLYTADGSSLLQFPQAKMAPEFEIPEGVEGIGELGFSMVRGVSELTIPSTMKNIGEMAFFFTQSLTKITCNAVTPPEWDVSLIYPTLSLFDDVIYLQAPLYVPAESVELYKKAPGWSNFQTICAIGDSGVDEVRCDNGNNLFFDISGRPLSKPLSTGITIERRGNTVSKHIAR